MIALGSDHAGFPLKEEIRAYLDSKGIAYKDYGTYSSDSVNYALFGAKVGKAVAAGECDKGILCCGTGIGISIAANKVPGVRAACCSAAFLLRPSPWLIFLPLTSSWTLKRGGAC